VADALTCAIKESGRFPTHVVDCSGEMHRWVTVSPRNDLFIVQREGTSVSAIPLSGKQNSNQVCSITGFYFADVTK
jgi:hypothetical protein